MLEFILLLAAFICFLLAAISVSLHARLNLIGAGLALFVLVPLIHAWPG